MARVRKRKAAAQRRLQGLPFAAEVAQGSSTLAPSMALNLLGYEQSVRDAQFNASPAGQLFNRLMQIAGMDTQAGLATTARGETDSWGTSASGGGKSGGA